MVRRISERFAGGDCGGRAFRVAALASRLRAESGVALPTGLAMITIAMAMAAVALASTNIAQRGSSRDEDRKEAIAAADAGLEQALYRQNKILTTTALPCLVPTATNTLGSLVPGGPLSDLWCPPVSGQVGTASYTYRVSPVVNVPPQSSSTGQGLVQTRMVATGTADGESRRAFASAQSPSGTDIFGREAAIGVNGVSIGGTAEAAVSVGSNQSVLLEQNGTICGPIRTGPGQQFQVQNNASQCAGYPVAEGLVTLPPPDLSAVYAENSNSRFFLFDPKTGNATWSPTSRTLSLSGGATVTMGGNAYLLCRLQMSGSSRLIVPAGAVTTIFFDTPENCGQTDPAEQISVTGSSAVISTSFNPELGSLSLPGIVMAGSDQIRTTAFFGGTGAVGNEFFLYAPRTDVRITGTADYHGQIAAGTLELDGTASLVAHTNAPVPDLSVVRLFERDRYVECTGASVPGGAPPDSSC